MVDKCMWVVTNIGIKWWFELYQCYTWQMIKVKKQNHSMIFIVQFHHKPRLCCALCMVSSNFKSVTSWNQNNGFMRRRTMIKWIFCLEFDNIYFQSKKIKQLIQNCNFQSMTKSDTKFSFDRNEYYWSQLLTIGKNIYNHYQCHRHFKI